MAPNCAKPLGMIQQQRKHNIEKCRCLRTIQPNVKKTIRFQQKNPRLMAAEFKDQTTNNTSADF